MMNNVYVFDSGPFINIFRHYYRSQFPSLWSQFDAMIAQNRITSTREVFNELKGSDALSKWCKLNKNVFPQPTTPELAVVKAILAIPHFQAMVSIQHRLQGRPVADPFIIARAKCLQQGCVVTTERLKPNAAKIPNVCKYFAIDCIELEQFMAQEQWRF